MENTKRFQTFLLILNCLLIFLGFFLVFLNLFLQIADLLLLDLDRLRCLLLPDLLTIESCVFWVHDIEFLEFGDWQSFSSSLKFLFLVIVLGLLPLLAEESTGCSNLPWQVSREPAGSCKDTRLFSLASRCCLPFFALLRVINVACSSKSLSSLIYELGTSVDFFFFSSYNSVGRFSFN